jgi:hypothetical protein
VCFRLSSVSQLQLLLSLFFTRATFESLALDHHVTPYDLETEIIAVILLNFMLQVSDLTITSPKRLFHHLWTYYMFVKV